MLILNADDFGYSTTVNRAIQAAFQEKICSSTTIMTNMPGFTEACQIVKKNRLEQKTGIHFVLTEGKALSRNIRSCSRFCTANGDFIWKRSQHLWLLSSVEKKAILEELQVQVEKCREAGLHLTHADSHNHAHEEWALLPLFIRVCKNNHIPWLRLARNCGKSTGWLRQGYRKLVNQRLKKTGLAKTHLFGSLQDLIYQMQKYPNFTANAKIEIMLHPNFDQQGNLIDLWENYNLKETIQNIPNFHSATAFSAITR